MKPLAPELEAKIDEVNLWLFDNDRERVRKQSGKSRQWVSRVLNKHAFNADVLEAAIEVMEQNKARFRINNSSLKIA